MKRFLVILVILAVVGLIVFTLFKNKAEMTQSAQHNFARAFLVAVAPAVKQTVRQTLTQQGSIVAANDVAVVSDLQTQGRITALMVKEGSYVRAGTPLLRLENQVPEANFLTAKTDYLKAQKDLERATTLNKEGLIPDSQVETARQTLQAAQGQYVAAQRQFQHAVITSPISGVISSLPVTLGTMVSTGMTVADVVDISQLKVKLNLDEANAFRLKTGDLATIETDVYPGVKFSGKVSYIGIKGDEAHTYPVEILLPNPAAHPLKSGMFGKVTFDFGVGEALTIPRDAILGSIDSPQVYVVADGKANLRTIQAGAAVDTNVIVLQGLTEGEKVVISGQYNLKDNVPVMVAGQNPGGRKGKGQGNGWPGSNGSGNNGQGWQGKQSGAKQGNWPGESSGTKGTRGNRRPSANN